MLGYPLAMPVVRKMIPYTDEQLVDDREIVGVSGAVESWCRKVSYDAEERFGCTNPTPIGDDAADFFLGKSKLAIKLK